MVGYSMPCSFGFGVNLVLHACSPSPFVTGRHSKRSLKHSFLFTKVHAASREDHAATPWPLVPGVRRPTVAAKDLRAEGSCRPVMTPICSATRLSHALSADWWAARVARTSLAARASEPAKHKN